MRLFESEVVVIGRAVADGSWDELTWVIDNVGFKRSQQY